MLPEHLIDQVLNRDPPRDTVSRSVRPVKLSGVRAQLLLPLEIDRTQCSYNVVVALN